MNKRKKNLFLCLVILVILCVIYLVKISSKRKINMEFYSTQEREINSEDLKSLKLTSDTMIKVLDKSYFEDTNVAGFNSRYIATDFLSDITWKRAFISYFLKEKYFKDLNMYEDYQENICNIFETNIVYEKLSIVEVYELLLFGEIIECSFDQSMLVNVLESYYNDKESLYQNREDASFSECISSTYYAVKSYSYLGLECPNKDNIKKLLNDEENLVEYFNMKDTNVSYFILLAELIDVDLVTERIHKLYKKAITNYLAYLLDDVDLEFDELVETTVYIDLTLIFEINNIIKANKFLQLDVSQLYYYINENTEKISLSDILCSKELTMAAYEIEESSNGECIILGRYLQQIEDYISENFKNYFNVNYTEEISVNSMDTYYGVEIADTYNFYYDQKKVLASLDMWFQEHLDIEYNENKYLFLYFDVLLQKKFYKTMERDLVKQIEEVSRSYINSLLITEDIEKLYPSQLVDLLFVIETMKLLNIDISKEEKAIVFEYLSIIDKEEFIYNTTLVSEVNLISKLMDLNYQFTSEKESIESLYYKGGFKVLANDDSTLNILSTAKMLRVDEYWDYIHNNELREMLDGFVVDGLLRYNREENGADLRTYYWFLVLMTNAR